MELLFEIILDLILEGSIEASLNKKVPKIIRYFLIILICLFFSIVILGLFIIGISFLNKNIYASLLIITVSIVMLIVSIYKFKKIYIEKRDRIQIESEIK